MSRRKGRLTDLQSEAALMKRAEEAARQRANSFIRKAMREKVAEAALTDEEIRDALRPRRRHMELLRELVEAPGRNAGTQMVGLKMMVEPFVGKARDGGSDSTVTVVVKTLEPVGSVTVGAVQGVTTQSLPSGD